MGSYLTTLETMILILMRMTGLFVIAPIFGRRNIPTYYKIGFSFILALVLVNIVDFPKKGYGDNLIQYGLLAGKEFLVGITIGYVAYLVFTGIYLAGQLVDMQVGFGMVNVIDPVSNIQVPVTSNIYFMISMLVFLSLNGHHYLIMSLLESYKFVPVDAAQFGKGLMGDIINVFSSIFVLGFKIAAPVIAAILVTDIALGVISRSVPQLNVFVVGMPLKIVMGIAVVIITIPVFVAICGTLQENMVAEMTRFLKDMAGK